MAYFKKYQIRCIEQCLECHGAKRITHPDWQELNERLEDLARHSTEPKVEIWNRLLDENPNMPPEEVQCPTCDGAGKLTYWVSLQEALQDTASF